MEKTERKCGLLVKTLAGSATRLQSLRSSRTRFRAEVLRESLVWGLHLAASVAYITYSWQALSERFSSPGSS